MTGLVITVHGVPAPQGSKRHVGNGRMVESSARVEPWRQDVRTAADKAMAESPPISGPLAAEIVFYLPRPKGHYGTGRNAGILRAGAPLRPSGKPDVDKLARAVLDALTAVVWLDDAQVADLIARKHYAGGACDRPGAVITVRQLTEQETPA